MRGEASRIIVKSIKSKIPFDFNSFLLHGENKTRLIELIFDNILNNRCKCWQILKSNKIVLSEDGECHFVTLSSSGKFDVLSSNQEEAVLR